MPLGHTQKACMRFVDAATEYKQEEEEEEEDRNDAIEMISLPKM